ncbi:MAG: VanZ family protein [Butyrivibrio sp.]|uniref:VanZ family protein n=1 Tax=Butyrivibrio sp. TaxID=28121 RepID=UPI0025F565DE|nr:VanZ family protein [Butyrivibrio sp.]MCR5771379.1 VanZ family protein [Butyrivibrio sp.]
MKYIRMYIKYTLRYTLKPLSFVPAIIMMYLIFSFSGQNATDSGALSYDVGFHLYDIINNIFALDLSSSQIADYALTNQFYIRKAAHITEYLLLAMSVSLPLYVYKVRGFKLSFFATAFCVLYAFLDEYHQTFSYGRTPQLRDVAIDSIGIVIGVIIVRILGFIGRKTVFKSLSEEYEEQRAA